MFVIDEYVYIEIIAEKNIDKVIDFRKKTTRVFLRT